MNCLALFLAGLHGFLAIACGAVAAHALQLDARELGWWNKAVFYQSMQALMLLGLGRVPLAGRWQGMIVLCAAGGALLFSGSLYLLALTHWRPLAFATPVGGLLMLTAWAALALYAWRGTTHSAHGE